MSSDAYKVAKYKLDLYSFIRKTLNSMSAINTDLVARKYLDYLSKLSVDDLKKFSRNSEHKKSYKDLPNPVDPLTSMLSKVFKEMWNGILDIGINHYILSELVSLGAIDDSTVKDLVNRNNFNRIASFETASEAEINAIRELQLLREKLRDTPNARLNYNLSSLYSSVGDLTLQQRLSYLETALKVNNRYKRQQAAKEVFLLSKYMKNRYSVLGEFASKEIDTNIRTRIAEYITERRLTDRVIERTSVDAFQLKEYIQSQVSNYVDQESKAARMAKTEISLGYNVGKLMAFTSPEDLTRRMVWRNDLEAPTKTGVCKACLAMKGRTYTVAELIKVAAVPPEAILNYGKARGAKTEFKNELYPVIPFHPNCTLAGTKVSIQNAGYANIEDIKVGDLVRVPTSDNYSKVIKTHKNWVNGEQIFKIRSASGQELSLTGNHPVWTGREWKEARYLSLGETIYLQSDQTMPVQETDISAIHKTTKHDASLFGAKGVESNGHGILEGVRLEQDTTGNKCSNKYSRDTKKIVRENVQEQSLQKPRNTGKNEAIKAQKRSSESPLYVHEWKGKIQSRIQRRLKYICKKFLGGKYGKNIELVASRVGIRKALHTKQWCNILLGLLHSLKKFGNRSEGILDRRCENEMGSVYSRVSSHKHFSDRAKEVQQTEEVFSGIIESRIESITSFVYTGYVYNLSVEDNPYYFANNILVHNCMCFWEIVDTAEDQELREKQYARTKVLKAIGITALVGLGITTGLLLARKNVYGTLVQSIVKVAKTVPEGTIYEQASDGLSTISKVLGVNESSTELINRIAKG